MPDNNFTKKIALSSVFIVLSAAAGLLEGLLPLELVIPIPGVKLGIANIFITAAFYILGAGYALGIMASRVLIVFIFSGNPISFVLSLTGGVLSIVSTWFMLKLYPKVFSFMGVSVVSAVSHGVGQIAAAYFIVGLPVMYYFPMLGIACSVTGLFTGILMNIFIENIKEFLKIRAIIK